MSGIALTDNPICNKPALNIDFTAVYYFISPCNNFRTGLTSTSQFTAVYYFISPCNNFRTCLTSTSQLFAWVVGSLGATKDLRRNVLHSNNGHRFISPKKDNSRRQTFTIELKFTHLFHCSMAFPGPS